MAGRTTKRSSDNYVLADTKKKKKTKEKSDADAPKEKITTVCNGDLRQKKAFFAYFGKTFVDEKLESSEKTNCDVDSDGKKSKEKNTSKKIIVICDNGENHSQSLAQKEKKKIVEKRDISLSINTSCFISGNSNLSYVSSFVEELGCFPKITHANWLAPLSSSNLMLHLNKETLYDSSIKDVMLSFQTLNTISERIVLEPYQMEINIPYMVSTLKKSAPNFPISIFFKQMKKQFSEAKKSKTNIEFMWIDKYKPTCKEEVLGNNKLVISLKKWLDPNKKNSKKSRKSKHYEDDDDFIFDTDSDSSGKAQRNLSVLLGPSGCGKTSAVYAVANELNANVIELNASCNRNGKRIITDLMEATQSHAVEKNCLLKMIKEKKKKIKYPKKKADMNEKMTIILIEDADVFFDNYDDGFLSAISTLATDSKRPLVLTANDPFNNQLLKFILSNEMTFNFVHPPKKHLSYFLQLMALNEGIIMSDDEINTFIHPFKPDIRQSILQLQYVLSTGEINQKKLNNVYKRSINSIWWNWPYMIGCYVPSVQNNKLAKGNINIETISRNLDSMSNLNLIYSKTQSYDFLDPQPFWHHLVMRDSASLIETNHWSDNSIQLSTDITEWIHNHINTQACITEKLYPSSNELSHRLRMWNTSRNILEQIGLDYCNRKNETCYDYLSTVRSLGQNNQVNQPFGNLRHSKMFSYLKRINIDVDCDDLKYLCNSLHSHSNCDQPIEISDQF